ncbi:MAG: hydrolase [Candidatus Magnetominusculus sp. LBB02]|nr:hydrolase [Candidatus Magnetominusculus sp. LBB02]
MLTAVNSAIVIVDIQERLAAAMPDRDKVTANALHMIELAKLMSIPIIVTEQYPKGLGPTVSEIKDSLPVYEPIEKTFFSACAEAGFNEILRRFAKKQVVLCGIETHICVLQTCLDLIVEGYEVHAVSDCTSSRTQENKAVGLGQMQQTGAVITSTETVIFQLLARAGTDEFKIMSNRIK